MTAPVDVLAVKSFAGRAHAEWIVVAGANPREKGIHDAAFGHYGITVAKVSFEREYSHAPEVGADLAADYADRLVACADAMKGIADPRAFVAAIDDLIEADQEYDTAKYAHACIANETYEVGAWHDHEERLRAAAQRLLAAGERRRSALANVGGAA